MAEEQYNRILPCYTSRAERASAAMAGAPDAGGLPPAKGNGSKALGNAVDELKMIETEIDEGLKAAEAAHYGRAADTANQSISEIKPHVTHAIDTTRAVKQTLDEQAHNQNTTFQAIPKEGDTLPDGRQALMKPPEKNWAESSGFEDLPGMGWTSFYEEKQARFQATNDRADAVMNDYAARTSDVTGRTPEFKPPEPKPAPPPARGDYSTMDASSQLAGSGYSSTPNLGGGGGAPAGTQSAWASGAATPGMGSYTPPPSPTPSAQAPAGTSSAWTSTGNGSLPPGMVRGPDGTVYRQTPNGAWERQNPYNGRWAPAPNGPPGGGAGRGGGAPAARGGGAPARGGTPSGSGTGGGRSLAPGAQSGRGSFGPSGSAPAGGPSASSSSSSSGRPMRAPMGGAGQQQGGGEEEEHERPSWLVESEDVFTDNMDRVAPPVLGALPDEEGGSGR